MQISLRSHLIAGTAAVVGASAIAMTPVVAQHDLALPAIQSPAASAEVVLAGYDSPISELFRSLGQLNNFVFGSTNTLADYAPFIQSPGGLAIVTGGYGFNAAGVLPQIINDAAPIVRQLGTNGSGYLGSTFNALYQIGFDLSEGVWNAAGQLATLNFTGAVNTLLAAVQSAGATALQAGNYVLTNVVAKATALASEIPTLANLVVGAVTGQAQVLAGVVVTFANNVVAAVQTGNPETIWNTVVDGLVGPSGLPGVINALTVGAGVQTGAATVVPSVRGVIQATVKGIATALATSGSGTPVPPPATAIASSPAPSASSLRAAAAETSAPAVETTKSNDSTSGGSATAGDHNGGSATGSSEGSGSGASKSTGGSARAAHKAAASKSSE